MSKIYFKKFSKLKISFAFAILAIFTFSSCSKTEEVVPNSFLSVVNMSPTAATYDVYLGDNRINAAALPFGGSIAYSAKTLASYALKFTVPNRSESVYTKNIDLTQVNYYTFYLINRPSSFDGLLIADNLSDVSADKALVRFINLSPDAPALDLVTTGGSAIVTSKAYKVASAYTTTTAGNTLSFDLKDAAGNVKATSAGNTLKVGIHYTIIASGFVNPVNAGELPLSIQIIQQ